MDLLIQTSSGEYEVALTDGTQVLVTSKKMYENTRSRNMGEHLAVCLQELAVDVSIITRILVDVGPGGLAATRSGVSFANALSYGLSKPIEGIPFFELLHAHVSKQVEAPALFYLRRGPGSKAFWAEYSNSDKGTLRLTTLDELRKQIFCRSPGAVVVGATSILGDNGELPGYQLIPQLHAPMEAFISSRAMPLSSLGNLTIVRPLTEHESIPNVRS